MDDDEAVDIDEDELELFFIFEIEFWFVRFSSFPLSTPSLSLLEVIVMLLLTNDKCKSLEDMLRLDDDCSFVFGGFEFVDGFLRFPQVVVVDLRKLLVFVLLELNELFREDDEDDEEE